MTGSETVRPAMRHVGIFASDPDAVRRHAAAVGMPADEVLPVSDTVIVRSDPEPAAT